MLMIQVQYRSDISHNQRESNRRFVNFLHQQFRLSRIQVDGYSECPTGVIFPRSLIQLLENYEKIICIKIQILKQKLNLADSTFQGVKTLKFPPTNMFIFQGFKLECISASDVLLEIAFSQKFLKIVLRKHKENIITCYGAISSHMHTTSTIILNIGHFIDDEE